MNKRLLTLAVAAALSSNVMAFEFDTPDDWEIRWDNTFKANLMSRVAAQDKAILQGENFFPGRRFRSVGRSQQSGYCQLSFGCAVRGGLYLQGKF